jgi:hypothetical protein
MMAFERPITTDQQMSDPILARELQRNVQSLCRLPRSWRTTKPVQRQLIENARHASAGNRGPPRSRPIGDDRDTQVNFDTLRIPGDRISATCGKFK